MPLAGRKPKPEGQALNTNPKAEWTEVEDVPFTGGPTLPPLWKNGERIQYPAATKRWWKAASSMPHCRLWGEAEWEFAFDTAALKAEFHRMHGVTIAAEVRQREKIMGTTWDARRDLRIRYIAPKAEPVLTDVASIDDYRAI